MNTGFYYQGISVAEGVATSGYFPHERYTIEITRDELASYYVALKEKLSHECGYRRYSRGR